MNRKITLTTGAAGELAKAVNIPGLAEAVATAVAASWDALTLLAEANDDGGYDVSVRPPNGVMVAWFLPDWIAQSVAVPGGEDASDLHVTLAYYGDADAMSLEDSRKLIGIVGEVCVRHTQLRGGVLGGTGRFVNGEDMDPFWVGVDIPGLRALRDDIVETARAAGFEPQGMGADDWHPHVTVAYIPKDEETPQLEFAPLEVYVDTITTAIGAQRPTSGLLPYTDDYASQPTPGWKPLTKAVAVEEEQRYTMGPWYVPDQLDAHGEWSDAAELQKALWRYVEKGNRDIRLQHHTDIVAGRWVEAMSWPFEVTVPLTKADGTRTEYTYPAGTPFMGTIWEPWAWDLIQDGKLSGYSIGGKSQRIEVDLGASALGKARDAQAAE